MRHDIEELKDALDLETYLQEEGIAFKATRGASGPQLLLRECPDCGNRNSKVYLNSETGLGNCFACGVGFNKLSFIHAHLSKPHWAETFKHVEQAIKNQGWRPKRMTAAAVEPPKAQLPQSFELPTPEGRNLTYLEARGVTGDIARYFHLRFCEAGFWLFKREDGQRGMQNFAGRVIIPIYDLDGEFVTFQGRDVTGAAERKYLFPVQLPGTGRYLFNGQNAFRTKRVCLGEGAFDAIALKLAFDEEIDLRDVVPIASFGKHLSHGDPDGNDQLSRLRRLKAAGLEEVTICYDGEAKALTAALDAGKRIAPTGLRVRIAIMPAGKDPNEISGQAMCDVFRRAQLWTPKLDLMLRARNPFAARCA